MQLVRDAGRRLRQRGAPPLAAVTLRVIAASPYPNEPDDTNYRPSLLVQLAPALGDEPLGAETIVYTTLLFAEWARRALDEPTLILRFQALLPRLRLAVTLGKVGPETLAAHRRGQAERYYHHRDAAAYRVELRGDRAGLYVTVNSDARRGAWTPAKTLLEAATVAPYEALLRLERADQLVMLTWLALAVRRWLEGHEAGFARAAWRLGAPPVPPGGGEA